MSNQYKEPTEVPTAALCKRMDELATAVTKGRAAVEREFVMRIPAELDYDPDLVLSEASRRLEKAEKLIAQIAGSPVKPTESIGRMWRRWCGEYFSANDPGLATAPQDSDS